MVKYRLTENQNVIKTIYKKNKIEKLTKPHYYNDISYILLKTFMKN